MQRVQHNLIQKSDDWVKFRFDHDGASEIAAAMGLSKKTTRNELLRMKSTGSPKEFSDYVQKHILDYGHEVEAKARPLVEAIIGEDLYPVTYSYGRLSASCDGLTMTGEIAFEHKQLAQELMASVKDGILPEEHMPQCQQIMLVTGAEKVIFTVSDGTPDNFACMTVLPDDKWQARIINAWAQFNADLKAYVAPEPVAAAPIGKTPETLPALRIHVTGAVTDSNLSAFKAQALGALTGINRDLQTDEDFATAKNVVKWCGDVRERLKAAKHHALSQTATIDELFRTIDDIDAAFMRVERDLDKDVKRCEQEKKDAIILKARQAYDEHCNALKAEMSGMWIQIPPPNFAEAAKNKRTLASLQNAVDTALANGKIAADASAKHIRGNLAIINAAECHQFLFADKAALIAKQPDDLRLLIKSRIEEHVAEIARTAAAKKLADEAAAAVQVVAVIPAQTAAPVTLQNVSHPATPITTAPTMTLGALNAKLNGPTVSAAFLETLGFVGKQDRSSCLYHAEDFQRICDAINAHITAVRNAS